MTFFRKASQLALWANQGGDSWPIATIFSAISTLSASTYDWNVDFAPDGLTDFVSCSFAFLILPTSRPAYCLGGCQVG